MHGQFAREFWASLALRHSEGLGPRTWRKLLEHYGSAEAAVSQADSWPDQGLATRYLAENLLQGKWREAALAEWRMVLDKGFRVLLYSDRGFPERLRQIPSPPLFLYFEGDVGLLARPCLAVVGSRSCSRYGLDAAGTIARDLSRMGLTVVSGFAMGIDRQAHAMAVSEAGRSIAVMGTGIDLIYPARNRELWQSMRERGLLLSEFHPGTRPEAHNFPKRNRIISGLCLGVLVVEAAKQSGSLITARMAMEQNRDVFALPGPINLETYAGCNALIREGAMLARSARDILDELEPVLRSEWPADFASASGPPPVGFEPGRQTCLAVLDSLNPEERQVAQFLLEHPESHIDSLAASLGWGCSKVSQILLMLEIQGVVKQLSGMYYSLVPLQK